MVGDGCLDAQRQAVDPDVTQLAELLGSNRARIGFDGDFRLGIPRNRVQNRRNDLYGCLVMVCHPQNRCCVHDRRISTSNVRNLVEFPQPIVKSLGRDPPLYKTHNRGIGRRTTAYEGRCRIRTDSIDPLEAPWFELNN